MEKFATLTFKVDLPGGERRLQEIILYVCRKCRGAERFGKVKLNKILWRSDFSAFRERRVPVTGSAYQKLAAGPAPMDIDDVLAEMQDNGLIEFQEIRTGGDYVEHRVLALRSECLDGFNSDDIYFVDKSIMFYWSKSATSASDLSHRAAWKSHSFLEPMPYESAFLSDEKLSKADRERLSVIARDQGWSSL